LADLLADPAAAPRFWTSRFSGLAKPFGALRFFSFLQSVRRKFDVSIRARSAPCLFAFELFDFFDFFSAKTQANPAVFDSQIFIKRRAAALHDLGDARCKPRNLIS